MMLWVFLQIYKNIFNNVSPSGFFIITAVPRSLTSAKSVDSVGGLRTLTSVMKSVGEPPLHQHSPPICPLLLTICRRNCQFRLRFIGGNSETILARKLQYT